MPLKIYSIFFILIFCIVPGCVTAVAPMCCSFHTYMIHYVGYNINTLLHLLSLTFIALVASLQKALVQHNITDNALILNS